eukprot:3376501-Rhodomonas_salina.2
MDTLRLRLPATHLFLAPAIHAAWLRGTDGVTIDHCRAIIRRGRAMMIKLGDKEVEYDENFKLYLQVWTCLRSLGFGFQC